ncbi:MAG: glycosyltransferase family 39 protein [Acidobacteria bacterium]|nr:glycosyltransferase family 39 protein [Acidobacteriota bacterium]
MVADTEVAFESSSSKTENFSSSPLLLFSSSPRLLFSSSPLPAIVLHLLITLPLAYVLNVWSDESSTLFSTGRGVSDAFYNVFANEKQAPLYFLLLSLWRGLNGSIFFARGLSILCGALAIWFFAGLARKFFDRRGAFLLTAFFALHPFLIWASLEIRLYSLVVLLTVMLLRFFADAYLTDDDANGRKRREILYLLTAVAGLYTNYYLGFVLVGNFAALLVLRRWTAARRYFLGMIVVGAAILPLLWMIKLQLAGGAASVQAPRRLAEGIRLIWNSGLNFVLPTELFPPENITTVSYVRVWAVRLLIPVAAFLLFKKRRALDPFLFAFGTIAAVVAGFLLVAYFLLGDIYVEIRHAAVLFPPLVLTAALVLRSLFGRRGEDLRRGEEEKRRRGDGSYSGDEISPESGALVAQKEISFEASSSKTKNLSSSPLLLFSSSPLLLFSSSLLLLFAYSIHSLYPEMAKRGDWGRVAEYIEQREKPGQPIVVFTVFDALNLPYHYRGQNRILPDERFFDWGFEGKLGGAEAIAEENEFAISKIPLDAPEIWLATGERCRTTNACALLENFVEANYTIIEEKDFYKERVRLLRKK